MQGWPLRELSDMSCGTGERTLLECRGRAQSPPPKRNEPKLPPTEKVCTECGRLKEIEAFTPIRACKAGHYGSCRTCRAARAKEHYWSAAVEPNPLPRRGMSRNSHRPRKCARSVGG